MEHYDDSIGGYETQRPESVPTLELDELIGQTLDGRYLIEQKLGRGGFGVVYLASDNKAASRKVVVKVMHLVEAANEWSRRRFKQEVEALSRIDHPSVVGLFDCGETVSNRPYIVMQYIDGRSLRSLLTPEGMSFLSVARIIRQIGDALTAAHEVGILHRDLKPENIMVKVGKDEERVKVIDFGIAKVKDSIISVSTAQGTTVGTIAYMSPEQLSAQPITPQSDIYSLGVIAYEMLTGRRPANPESAFNLLEMQRAGVRIKPIDLRPALPEAANNIVLKALSFQPSDRYERAREFANLLAEALLDHSQQFRSTTVANETTRNSELQTAHVLFMDIVGYSKLLIDDQTRQLRQLQQIVLATNECKRAHAAGELIRLPTGDGMALVFSEDPEAPVRCAIEISKSLKADPLIELRMGVHSGLVYRVADINTNMNVAGGGINVAQRVMDCGDPGHILLSKRVADDLGQLARWSTFIADLGEAEVKHGIRLHLFNLSSDDFGNPAHPTKLEPAPRPGLNLKKFASIAALILVVGLAIAGIWYVSKIKSTSSPVESPVVNATAPIGPERSLIYWLTVQKMQNGRTVGSSFQSAGDNVFGNGWKFQFNFQPMQSGALYVVGVGTGRESLDEYNVLFPLPQAGRQNATVSANQTIQSEWLVFTDKTGSENIWIIWSASPMPALDSIFAQAAQPKYQGEIADAGHIEKVKEFLKLYDATKLQVVSDKSTKITSIKGHGDVVVGLLTLSHEAY
ncbi:MAG TPA: protein kinase [Pyrinomonadaceae bacterium]|nr:protein kinase [Pyrinomonadaceae bacterium]